MVVNGNIYEGLTAIDKDLKTVPGLAQSWSISADGKTYTFKLRSGVKFHDGSAMEAEDVVSTIKRVLSKDIASPLASRLSAVDSANAVDATDRRDEAQGALRCAPELARPHRHRAEFHGGEQGRPAEDAGRHGPVQVPGMAAERLHSSGQNEAYWDKGMPKLAGLKFNIVPESATRQVGLSNGQYALLPNIDAATALQLKGKPNAKLAETMDLAYTLIGMNTSKPPFDNPKVREAVNYAINRQEIVDAALFGAGVPGGPLSPALKSWALNVNQFACYKPDPAKAQALLKEAGVATPVAVSMKVLPRQDIKDIAQVVQEQLNKAGFKVELINQEQGQFIQDWRNSNFDLFASLNAGQPDPDDYFFRTFRTGGSTNVFKYSDTEIDGLLDQARTTQDQAARKAAYDKVQQKLACSGPVAHLTYGTLFSAMNAKLQGYDVMPNRSLLTLRNASY